MLRLNRSNVYNQTLKALRRNPSTRSTPITPKPIISSPARRKLSTYYNNGYNFYQPPKTPFYQKFLYVLALGTVAGGVAYYLWWPKHTFPSSVAKILRKGLHAESDKGDCDFQLALKYYIQALQECDNLEMDKLSDEYTGIQLKIAEMFERMHMIDDAAFIYNEIAILYLKVLTAPPKSKDGARIKNEAHRAHLIQKDLRIAVKIAMLNEDNYPLCKGILTTHLLIAQDLVQRRLGPKNTLSKLFDVSRLTEEKGKPSSAATTSSEPPIKPAPVGGHSKDILNSDGNVVGHIETNPMAWEPFSTEFFGALDFLMTVCLKMGDVAMATSIKTSANEWSMIAELDPAQIMMSLCNLAALLYIEAGTFEEEAYKLKKITDRTPQEEDRLQKSQKLRLDAIDTSMKVYKFLVDYLKQLPSDYATNNKEVHEAVAIATFGMGVINLHEGEYDSSERLLREARVRSKQCGYDSLIGLIETELDKLFKEKKKAENKKIDEEGLAEETTTE